MPASRSTPALSLSNGLRSYFYSGWAFLIPYLAVYLLYYATKWPVNASAAATAGERLEAIGQGVVKAGSSPLTPIALSPSPIPCMLHVYWALHVVHVILAGFALWTWLGSYRSKNQGPRAKCQESDSDLPTADIRHPTSGLWPLAIRLAPWALLALLFYIPGVYLEWPSDPWDHLRRINEWHILDEVTSHSSWKKYSYFLPYSLTGHLTGRPQISLLNYYYVGICLLLSWQYSRLGRAVGLGERASVVFALINAITFGNNIFSFYRYYGLSSSIFAQIGAVALTRIALEHFAASVKRRDRTTPPNTADPINDSKPALAPSLTASVFAGLVLGPFIGFSHIQGIGIAGLGVLAVIVWRLVEWKRSMILWLALAAILASAAIILWFPRHPALDDLYRPSGWLTAWYGFNLYSLGSVAFERSLQILGLFGVITLALGLWLVARNNHVVGWLSLMPIIALTLPCFALPFAHVVAANTSPGNIITFHRMLLAVPMGLALVAALCLKNVEAATRKSETNNRPSAVRIPLILIPSLIILLALTITPGTPGYNRFWHSILNTQDDLQLRHHMTGWKPATHARTEDRDILKIDSPLGNEIQQVFFLADNVFWEHLRLIEPPLFIDSLDYRLRDLRTIIHLYDLTPLNTDSVRLDRLTFPRRAVTTQKVAAAPTSTDHPWLALGGVPTLHTFANGQLTISNPMGNDSVTFNQDLIPISRYKRYRLTSRVRQTGSTTATNFLAVAWYDRDMRLLQSRLMQPQGAGAPRGWNNSTFSFYGLVDQPASTAWTLYSISLGLGESASIPANASYLRVGALLNYRATPEAKVEITDVTLVENPAQSHLQLTASGFWHLYTPASQAALLSTHWATQYVPTAHAGTQELRSTAIHFRSSD